MSAALIYGPGHPDQACDLVAAAVVEEYLRRDPEARLNIRVCGGKGALFLAGEVTSTADFDVSAFVKQTLAACGVLGVIEPFIAFEPMNPAWAKTLGAREPMTVQGYATRETAELLPKSQVLSRALGRCLEEKRLKDPDWFWLGPDYEIQVTSLDEAKTLVLIRAEHVDTEPLERVRARLESICVPFAPDAEFRINPAGKEIEAGLTHRVGSSGHVSFDAYTHLPVTLSGVGRHVRHPRVLGPVVCRAVARRLVKEGRGLAVVVRATWLPFEMRATIVRAWNERGQDLTTELKEGELDLTLVPATWTAPHIATDLVKIGTDTSIVLPWEV
jgi:hypothetical protein